MSGQDQRRAPRYQLQSIKAELTGAPVEIVDVSPTGVLLSAGSGASLKRGDTVTLKLSVPLMKKIVPVSIDGFVVRNDERGLAIDYVTPAITWPQVLRVLDNREHQKAG